METFELTWAMLHRYNPKLTESQFRLGITGIGADFPSLELQPRWERVGEHAMVARLMLHCLQDLHVTLAGYREVSASSLEAMYDAVYRYLINWVPSAKTSEKRLRKYRVDRLIGFIMSEVDEKLLGRILTPEIMAASVRQLVPARQALRSYESKNPGLLQERVISSGEFIRIRLSLRSKSADGEGRTLDEARTQAQEKLADLLYDGNFPTLRDTYPQRAREDNKPNSQMVAWTKIFGISDDMTARLLPQFTIQVQHPDD